MKRGSSKHQLRAIASEDYEVREKTFERMPRRLPGASEDFYAKSYSFELLRPENQYKARESTFEQMPHRHPGASEDFYVKSSGFDFNKARVDNYNQRRNYKVYEEEEEEDVNTEADEFIKYEHKKFLLSKTMSVG